MKHTGLQGLGDALAGDTYDKKTRLSGGFATIFAALCSASGDGDRAPLLPRLSGSPLQVISTVPANGDVNPYGVAFVPYDFASGGSIHPGDVDWIFEFQRVREPTRDWDHYRFSHLSWRNAIAIFPRTPRAWIIDRSGSFAAGCCFGGECVTRDGMLDTVGQGSLIAIDRYGKQIASFTDSTFLDGPWDLTLIDLGSKAIVFVSNVLNGKCVPLDV